MPILPRDFIETADGLMFAVVDGQLEEGRVLCFLRYARDGASRWAKLATAEANTYLQTRAPHYLWHSPRLQADLHGVAQTAIVRHHQPAVRLRVLLNASNLDPIEAKARRLTERFVARGLDSTHFGLTGSLLIGAQRPSSDLDFVVYHRQTFHAARVAVREWIASGALADLDAAAWQDAYQRRGCDLAYPEYLWHERRKVNKALIDGTKFDLTFVDPDATPPAECQRKLGTRAITARVLDDRQGFDYPARYGLDHPDFPEVLCFTQTYMGQAVVGESVEIAGLAEQTALGRRIVVGSSREAPGEFIRVLRRADQTGVAE